MHALVQHISSLGLTRGQFAKRIGISSAYLSQIISRARKPSLEIAVRIARETRGEVPVEMWIDHHGSPTSLPGSEVSACSQKLAVGKNDSKGDAT